MGKKHPLVNSIYNKKHLSLQWTTSLNSQCFRFHIDDSDSDEVCTDSDSDEVCTVTKKEKNCIGNVVQTTDEFVFIHI